MAKYPIVVVKENPGTHHVLDQYNNPANTLAHYENTAPEIWEQTGGKLDYFICGMGTGGTITGAGRYLKEQKSELIVVGVDPVGSIFTAVWSSEVVAPPMSRGTSKPSRSISFATCTISSRLGVMSPDSPMTSAPISAAVSRIFAAGTMTPRSITS